ncbi:MAG: signal transduction histidine kinase [Flavipsychrobacter sp.]|nr:signal transduction histidine kinase [Flavipsychrobacter sp.]
MPIRALTICLLMCLFLLVCCKNKNTRNMGVRPYADTLLIDTVNILAGKQTNTDSGILLCKKAFEMSQAANYARGMIISLKLEGLIYLSKNEYDHSITLFKQSFSHCRTPGEKALMYVNIGNAYEQKGDYVVASQNYYAGMAELQKIPVRYKQSAYTEVCLYTQLANINYYINQDSSTINYLNKAESLAREWQFPFQLVAILINKSSYYMDHKQTDASYLLEALEICRKNNLRHREVSVTEALGSLYGDMKQYEKAITYFKAGLELTKSGYVGSQDNMFIFSSYGIGECLYNLKKYKDAEQTIITGLRKAQEQHILANMPDAYSLLSGIYRDTKQYKKAITYLDTFYIIRDSLAGKEKTAAINQMQVKYESAEKDKQLSLNQLMIAQQNNRIARKNTWILGISGGVSLLLLAIGGMYMQTVHKRRSLEKENKIGILQAAVTGGDNERTRIARELHDGIGGMLSAAMMRFSSMHHENKDIANTTAYKDAMNILHEMGDEIRKTAHNLMPEVLLKQSLPEAIRIFCNNVQEDGNLQIDFQSYGTFEHLTQNYKLNMYRITQELIKNVTIHAHASKVLVQLLQDDRKVMVSVEDNGKGFNMKDIKGGMGLHNIRTRVSSMDGHFTLESQPGKGTTVIVELELSEMMKPAIIDDATRPA